MSKGRRTTRGIWGERLDDETLETIEKLLTEHYEGYSLADLLEDVEPLAAAKALKRIAERTEASVRHTPDLVHKRYKIALAKDLRNIASGIESDLKNWTSKYDNA